MAKVIHVHLFSRPRGMVKDFFSSIAAVYTILTAEDVGATLNYLQHAGLSGNGTVVNVKGYHQAGHVTYQVDRIIAESVVIPLRYSVDFRKLCKSDNSMELSARASRNSLFCVSVIVVPLPCKYLGQTFGVEWSSGFHGALLYHGKCGRHTPLS